MFTLEELKQEVRRLAEENPDFIYRPGYLADCQYLSGGDPDNPGCIMGRSILSLAPECRPLLEKFDREGKRIGVVLNHLIGEQDYWFFLVQKYQDTGVSWQTAVFYADKGA